MLKVALTGGIGSGKTSVTTLFASFGTPIIDADVIGHQLCEPKQPVLTEIANIFGDHLLHNDGSLNRAELRALVFANPAKKKQLESLLHPLIYAEIAAQITQLRAPYCVICVPLLLETQKIAIAERILVVDCSVEQQIERVQKRSQLSVAQIHAMIATQASRAQRLAVAHDVIDNSKSSAYLAEQVKKLHNSYLLLSSA